MPAFKITIAYDGTNYAGWQVQTNALAIQEVIERAIEKISTQKVRVMGSGRTDSGVHAIGQVASFSVETRLAPRDLQRALNGNLPFDIRILDAEQVDEAFHAQHDAVRKTYRYVIQDHGVADVFQIRYAWQLHRPLDNEAMHAAGQHWVGAMDFASFQGAGSRRDTTTRTVESLVVSRGWKGDERFLTMEVTSNGFLYNMVRIFIGTLQEIGRGNQPIEWAAEVLTAKDRKIAGYTAPAHGLYLVNVEYPDKPPQT